MKSWLYKMPLNKSEQRISIWWSFAISVIATTDAKLLRSRIDHFPDKTSRRLNVLSPKWYFFPVYYEICWYGNHYTTVIMMSIVER